VRIRRLDEGEREPWLELLDGWELPDGWRGRDFFRRPLDADPSYADENVWVAESGGRLLSCVQIFPRRLCVRGVEIATGGIGSVFTRAGERGAGLASAVLEAAAADMRRRGMLLSLLFAARIPLYHRLGWRSWPLARSLLRRAGAAPARPEPGLELGGFVPARDLDAVTALHAEGVRRRSGLALRDAAEWRASLRLAGNPVEEFRVARRAGAPVAYLRCAVLSGHLVALEFAAAAGEEPALAGLLEGALRPRAPDPLAPAGRSSESLRGGCVLALRAGPALAEALARSGIEEIPLEDPTVMLRCLDAEALARRLGLPRAEREDAEVWLRRVLPPADFGFWPSDRF
jgi:GNAT superfamily N-acetyltransferase